MAGFPESDAGEAENVVLLRRYHPVRGPFKDGHGAAGAW
jgi:hypothetical protein